MNYERWKEEGLIKKGALILTPMQIKAIETIYNHLEGSRKTYFGSHLLPARTKLDIAKKYFEAEAKRFDQSPKEIARVYGIEIDEIGV